MVTRKFLSKIYSLLTVDGERLFYLALSSEETEEDGFFFFQCEDWSERYGIPKPTIKRYLKHLEDKTDFQSKSIINETIKQKENYKDGVNIKDAETIGKLLNISFKLYSPDQRASIDINTTKNNYHQIPLINNTSNHVELFKQKEVEVTTEEINKLIFQLFKKKQYHMFPASKQIKYLYTVDTKYINIDDKIKDELFDDFIKEKFKNIFYIR